MSNRLEAAVGRLLCTRRETYVYRASLTSGKASFASHCHAHIRPDASKPTFLQLTNSHLISHLIIHHRHGSCHALRFLPPNNPSIPPPRPLPRQSHQAHSPRLSLPRAPHNPHRPSPLPPAPPKACPACAAPEWPDPLAHRFHNGRQPPLGASQRSRVARRAPARRREAHRISTVVSRGRRAPCNGLCFLHRELQTPGARGRRDLPARPAQVPRPQRSPEPHPREEGPGARARQYENDS
ncbi:unnamed protein product [Chondrus crispus]|uniref:Uncharacterized protein n=1 Tax=Chondrus crispus TaxID=2769 RepID=R7Q2P9_CHOCR|nr:unnamed protein product [Chondrus crispus]CDF32163.1 unnamed protein product [Chondrus crispus]|eukprot:XP_005711828.1 unnamed protein product [Chondrus crispus]